MINFDIIYNNYRLTFADSDNISITYGKIVMYLDYYDLHTYPFSISPDPAFLWFGPKHQAAFSALRYGIIEQKGFLCLTGEVGTGKTVLIRNLVNTIEIPAIIISVPDPDMKPFEFFRYVAREIQIEGKFRSKADFLLRFKSHLNKAFGTDTRVLMVIDEAQRLSHALLEQIRLLSNIAATPERKLNVFLVGQNEFNDLLLDERARATSQRIAVRHSLSPLNADDINAYIFHRLQVAGAHREIFMPDAIAAVARQTNGIPRSINVLCDQALLKGYKANATVINAEIINNCQAAVNLPQTTPEEDEFASAYPDIRNELDDSEPPTDSHTTPLRSWFKPVNFAVLAVIAMLAGFTGYQIYRSSKGTAPRWEMQEIAPKKEFDSLIQPKKPFEDPKQPAQPAAERKTRTAISSKIRAPGSTVDRKGNSDGKATALNRRVSERDHADKAESLASATDQTLDTNRSVVRQGSGRVMTNSKLILYFDYNSTELTDVSSKDLRKYLSEMNLEPGFGFQVNGHTDSVGDFWYNMKLSQRRANTVRDLLIEHGIKPANIAAAGMGSKNPQGGSDSPEGRRKNRRVEIILKRVP